MSGSSDPMTIADFENRASQTINNLNLMAQQAFNALVDKRLSSTDHDTLQNLINKDSTYIKSLDGDLRNRVRAGNYTPARWFGFANDVASDLSTQLGISNMMDTSLASQWQGWILPSLNDAKSAAATVVTSAAFGLGSTAFIALIVGGVYVWFVYLKPR